MVMHRLWVMVGRWPFWAVVSVLNFAWWALTGELLNLAGGAVYAVVAVCMAARR